jgi:hypothetical protein
LFCNLGLFHKLFPVCSTVAGYNKHMIGRTHDAAAFAALLGVYLVTPPASMSLATILIAVLANQLGGIAPDIDQPTAPLWRTNRANI